MQGSSRTSFAQARESFLAATDAADATATGYDLLSVAGLLSDSAQLRAALSDSGESVERRNDLFDAVVGGQVGARATAVVHDVVSRRWATSYDLTDTIELLGSEALLMGAEAEGRIDSVEEELFRFARVVEGNSELQSTLANQATETPAKLALVGELLDGRTQPETSALVRHAVAHPGGRRIEDALSSLVERAASRREQLLADVRVAQPLTTDQEQRMAAALTRVYGKRVVLQTTVDPNVMGGAVVKIGEEVVDGSIATRLADVRRMMHS